MINIIFIGVVISYTTMDVITAFKEKKLDILVSYMFNMSLLTFLYLLPISLFLSSIILFRRFFSKKLDLIIQGFSVPPLKVVKSILILALFLSAVNTLLSFSFYPSVKRSLFHIEKEFKKRQKVEKLVLNNFWIAVQEDGVKKFVNFKLIELQTGMIYGSFIVEVRDNSIARLIRSDRGRWENDQVVLENAIVEDFRTSKREEKNVIIPLVNINEVEGMSEKIDHLSFDSLLNLYTVAKEIGLNANIYMYEIMNRLTLSLFPLFSTVIVLGYLLKYRDLRIPSVIFIVLVFCLLLVITVQKLMAERFGINPVYSLIFGVFFVGLSLKSLYDLGKGFRV